MLHSLGFQLAVWDTDTCKRSQNLQRLPACTQHSDATKTGGKRCRGASFPLAFPAWRTRKSGQWNSHSYLQGKEAEYRWVAPGTFRSQRVQRRQNLHLGTLHWCHPSSTLGTGTSLSARFLHQQFCPLVPQEPLPSMWRSNRCDHHLWSVVELLTCHIAQRVESQSPSPELCHLKGAQT